MRCTRSRRPHAVWLTSAKVDYVITAVKDNQRTIHDDLKAIQWDHARWSDVESGKGHGRLAQRRCAVFDITAPDELMTLVRNHWHIENRLHYVRDFTYDEDRCRARADRLPRNLACLSNAAIVRLMGEFRYLPQANRHYATRPQDALDAVLTLNQP